MTNGRTPDLGGQVIVVTGANSGIGLETAAALASMSATVVMTARNRAQGEAALAEVRERSGNDGTELADLDLASLRLSGPSPPGCSTTMTASTCWFATPASSSTPAGRPTRASR